MSLGGVVLVALAVAVGILGIVVPVLPGTLLIFAALAVWAFVANSAAGWVTFGLVTALLGAGQLIKYLWPMRRMRRADISTSTLVVGAVLGIVGFFVIPVLGLVLGFVGGVYVAELGRRGDARAAWAATVQAIKGVALSVGLELAAALLATTVWVVGLLVT